MDPWWTPDGPQMDLRRTPDGSLMVPRRTPDGPLMDLLIDPRWTPDGLPKDTRWIFMDTRRTPDHPIASAVAAHVSHCATVAARAPAVAPAWCCCCRLTGSTASASSPAHHRLAGSPAHRLNRIYQLTGSPAHTAHRLTGSPAHRRLRARIVHSLVCLASKGKSDHYHRESPQPMDGDVARIQMDFIFVGAEGTFVGEPRAKATVLMVICKDDGNLSATESAYEDR